MGSRCFLWLVPFVSCYTCDDLCLAKILSVLLRLGWVGSEILFLQQYRMRGEKDEKMQFHPLFPRLHIDDTEQGAQRAPPGNKMALCVGSISMRSLPSSNSINFETGHCQNHKVGRLHSNHHLSGMKTNIKYREFQLLKPGNYKAFKARQSLSSHHPYRLYNSVNLPAKLRWKEDDDDYRIQRFGLREIVLKEQEGLEGSVDKAEMLHPLHESGNRESVHLHLRKDRFVNGLSTLCDDDSELMHQDCRNLVLENSCIEIVSGNPERVSRKTSSVAMEGPPTCSSSSPKGGDHHKPLHLEEAERSAISDTSVVDSTSRLDITPDDVARLIGPTLFWKLRRTIDHQQRVFATQIFELHRLIKVQRLIARSPEILEGNAIFSKPSVTFSTETKQQRKIFPEPPALSLKPCADYAAEDVQKKNKKGDINPNSMVKPCSGASSTATSLAPEDTNFGPCLLKPPSGYQWLIPVRSPSEGLVYKPYTGPFQPTSGFIAPVFGAARLTRMDAVYVNTDYSFPALNQQGIVIYTGPDTLGHSCFQTYAPSPKMNTSNPDSAATQYIIPCQNSSNTSQENGMMTDSDRNLPVSKECDIKGSSGSNPGERAEGDAISLFPTTPTDQMSRYPDQDQNNHRNIQVIKVVPHNPMSASESAARIFRSIQEERKQHIPVSL